LSLGEFPAIGKAHAEACAAILAACQRVNKPCGAYAFSLSLAQRFVAQGFQLVNVGADLELVRDGLAAAALSLRNSEPNRSLEAK
jgi:2-keto-3-deoxy-L-rhamnonate aldolase RhmA